MKAGIEIKFERNDQVHTGTVVDWGQNEFYGKYVVVKDCTTLFGSAIVVPTHEILG